MSYYLWNPGGRMVVVETPEEYQEWAKKPGFRVPMPHEVQTFIQQQEDKWQDLKNQNQELTSPSAYLATVSQGGKDGYGIASAKMIRELRTLGVNIELHNKRQKVGILFHAPYSILRMENQFRLLFTMFESTKLPDDWRDYLDSADLIIVPSKWCQEVFAKFGFETRVVPLGYDTRTYKYVDRPIPIEQNKDFRFIHYNAFNVRKGFMEVWEAFNKAFRKDEPVKLILKTTIRGPIPLPITPTQYPNVIIEQGSFEDFEMMNLLESAHCFVYPARGEGFGLTPLEAMATGLPTIIPNATGMTEYFDPNYMYEVKVKEWVGATYKKYRDMDVGKMAMCDVDDLARQMRWVYEHQSEAKEKGRQASDYVQQWTWTKTAEELKKIIDEFQDMPTENRPIRNILTLEEVR